MINLTNSDSLVIIIPNATEIHYFGSCNDRIANNVAPRQFAGIITEQGKYALCSNIVISGTEIKYINLFNAHTSAVTIQLGIKNDSGLVIISTVTLESNGSEYLVQSEINNKILFNLSPSNQLGIITTQDCDIDYSASYINYGKATVNKPIQSKGIVKIANFSVMCTGNNPAGTGVEYLSFQNNDSSISIFVIGLNLGGNYIRLKQIEIAAGESLYIDRNTIQKQASGGASSWNDISGKPISTPVQIDGAVADSHTHSNQPVLDRFEESRGDLIYGGNRISTIDDSIINAIVFG